MTHEELLELRKRAGDDAIDLVSQFETTDGLASALVRRYMRDFEDSLDDYAASWDASRTAPDGKIWPKWANLNIRFKARYIGLVIARSAIKVINRLESIESDVFDSMPEAWEITSPANYA